MVRIRKVKLLAGKAKVRRKAWLNAGAQLVLREIFVFLAVLALVDLVLRIALVSLALGDNYERSGTAITRLGLYHEAQSPVDVLLIGNSRIQAGVDPVFMMNETQSVLGKRPNILNLGLAGGTPQANYWLLKNVISSDKAPKLIIYGAAEYEFNVNSIIRPNNYANDFASIKDYRQAFPDFRSDIPQQAFYWLSCGWYALRERNTIRVTAENMIAPSDPELPAGSVRNGYGFAPLDHTMTATDIVNMRKTYTGPKGYLRDYNVDGYQQQRFDELIQLALSRGIRLVIINMPITQVHQEFLVPDQYETYRQMLNSIATKFGVKFIDYNDHSLWQEPDDFADTHHLNQQGAQKFTQMVTSQVLIPIFQEMGWP